jgi:hypothetical protein
MQPLPLSVIERSRCKLCSARMQLMAVSYPSPALQQRTFECGMCDQVEIKITAADPIHAVSGWLSSELKPPQ